jgi:hypothetical protein
LAGDDVVGGRTRREIHRDLREMLGGAALQEQHLVVRRNRHQRAQVGFGFFGEGDEVLAAMADFHHRGARARPLEHFVAGLRQYGFRNRSGAGREVVGTAHKHSFARPAKAAAFDGEAVARPAR